MMLFGLFISKVAALPFPPALQQVITEQEKLLAAQISVSLLNTETKQSWSFYGDRRVPMASTFKTLACATLLDQVEHQKLDLQTKVMVKAEKLQTYSPRLKDFVGQRIRLQDACDATMQLSDNTAANLVLEAVGGPAQVTLFLRSIGDEITRVDRIEPFLNEATPGDLRDTTTANAINQSLYKLLFTESLSAASRVQLQQWMISNRVSDALLRSVLPPTWKIGDRSGAGGFGARGITAVVWPAQHPAVMVSIFINQTEASFEQRNASIAMIGDAIFKQLLTH